MSNDKQEDKYIYRVVLDGQSTDVEKFLGKTDTLIFVKRLNDHECLYKYPKELL